jgi:hypothetical protein
MQQQKVQLPLWDEMVAPLAYHYFPQADHLGVQYPPGTGLMLALFPEGKALHRLNRLVIAVFAAAGFFFLIVAAIKRLPFAAGFIILTITLALEMLANLDNASFSMNALLVPLLLSGLCLASAWSMGLKTRKSFWLAWSLVLLAGLLFGFAVLSRLPVIFLLPGIVLLLWPGLRALHRSALVPFVLGVVLGGMLPLMVHQSRVAGAWYLTTYGQSDITSPTFERVRTNAAFYFGPGKSSTVNFALPVILVGCVGLLLLPKSRWQASDPATLLPQPSWIRFIAAALLILAVSNIYFLSHFPASHYYPWPAILAALLTVSLGSLALEHHSVARFASRQWPAKLLLVAACALSMLPGAIAMGRAWSHYAEPTAEMPVKQFSLPAELKNESAWVWACELSGTLWYYARKPAHKLTSTNADTRELVFRFVRERHEPQYLINDGPSMQAVADEVVQLGGKLEPRGEIDNHPYYLIHW